MNLETGDWAFIVLIVGYAALTVCELVIERFWWQWRIAQVELWLRMARKRSANSEGSE